MSKQQHTPGPWKTAGKEKRLIVDSESRLICSTSYSMNDYEGTITVAQADARLIASAPELLAALKGTLEYMEANVREAKPGTYAGDRLIAARAAISKATGA